jgi:predicted permease
MSVVALILISATLNVSLLLVAQALSRQREFVLRAAIGASRSRVVRQLVTESLLICAIGASFGLFAGHIIAKVISVELALPATIDTSLNAVGFLLACAVTVAAVAAVGFAAAFRLTKGLSQPAVYTGPGRTPRRWAGRFIAFQAMSSMCFLVIGGLFARAVTRVEHTDYGFDMRRLVEARVPRVAGQPSTKVGDWTTALQQLQVIPSIEGAALADHSPFSASGGASVLFLNSVSPTFFDAMGIQFLKGRPFTGAEAEAGLAVAVVTERVARRRWQHADDAIGKNLGTVEPSIGDVTIVGVVKDAQTNRLGWSDAGTAYLPLAADDEATTALIRTKGDASATTVQLVRGVLTSAPIANRTAEVWPVARYRDSELMRARRMRLLALGLGGIAVALSVVGIAGLSSFSVAQRTGEIAVRFAIGATRMQVALMLLWDSLRASVIGMVAGMVLALLIGRVLSSMLAGVSATDPTVLAWALIFFLLITAATVASPVVRTVTAPGNTLRTLRDV